MDFLGIGNLTTEGQIEAMLHRVSCADRFLPNLQRLCA